MTRHESVAPHGGHERRRWPPVCYTRRDQSFEEEPRRLRAEGDRRRRTQRAAEPAQERREEKPLTEKAKELVGAK